MNIINQLRPQIFGLRDFYCLIKEISREIKVELSVEENKFICLEAIQRNFGGYSEPKKVLSLFEKADTNQYMGNLFEDCVWDLTL